MLISETISLGQIINNESPVISSIKTPISSMVILNHYTHYFYSILIYSLSYSIIPLYSFLYSIISILFFLNFYYYYSLHKMIQMMTIIQVLNLITFILYSILYQASILSYALFLCLIQYQIDSYQVLSFVSFSCHLKL